MFISNGFGAVSFSACNERFRSPECFGVEEDNYLKFLLLSAVDYYAGQLIHV